MLFPSGLNSTDRDTGHALRDVGWSRVPLVSGSHQHSLWSFTKSSVIASNIVEAFLLPHGLNVERLGSAITMACSDHDLLRASYPVMGDDVYCLIAPSVQIDLNSKKLEGTTGECWQVIAAEMSRLRREKFDLSQAPMHLWRLFTMPGEGHVLVLSIDHLIADAWSIAILIRTVLSYVCGVTQSALKPQAQPEFYWNWLDQKLISGAQQNLSFWKNYLYPLPEPLKFNLELPRPEIRRPYAFRIGENLDQDLLNRLRAVGRMYGVTVFSLLNFGIANWVYEVTGVDDFLLYTQFADRENPRVHATVGYLLNHIFLRAQFRPNEPPDKQLTKLQADFRACVMHRHVPASTLFSLLGRRQSGPVPVLQVAHAYSDSMSIVGGPESTFALEDVGPGTTPYLFDVGFVNTCHANGFRLAMMFNDGLFTSETARQLTQHFVTTIYRLLARLERQRLAAT